MEHVGGVSPAWPFPYEELEPWYCRAEQLFQVRGALGEDPTEPLHSQPYPFPPVPDEPPIAAVRARLKRLRACIRPRCRSASTSTRWLAGGRTPWDAFPNTGAGKMDAESAPLAEALRTRTSSLVTGAMVERLEAAPDGKAHRGRSTIARTARPRRCRRSSSSSAPAPSTRRRSCCARRPAGSPIPPTRSAATS